MFHQILLLSVFLNSISAQEQVLLFPEGQYVFTLSENVNFVCFLPVSTGESRFQWLLNGTHLEELNLTSVEIIENSTLSGEDLIIRDLTLDYNDSTIQCVVTFVSGDPLNSSVATILVQGLLPAVDGLTATAHCSTHIISLTWTAPFSLNITAVDPDITYCVDVVDSSSMSALHSECDLTDTGFNYSTPSSWAYNYTFTVTPVNGAGNGTPATVEHLALTAPRVSEQQVLLLLETYQMNLSSLVCKSELTFEDVDTGMMIRLGSLDINISSNIISFNMSQLSTNRLYNVTVNASNPSGSATSNTIINTHDIQNITISNDSSVVITVNYVENTQAMGALLILLYTSDKKINFNQSAYLTLTVGHTLTFNDTKSFYMVLTYDIEKDGRLQDDKNYPATRNNMSLDGNNAGTNVEEPQSVPRFSEVSCSVSHDNLHVSVMCDCKNVNTTGYQVLLQYNSLDDIHRLLVGSGTCVPVSLVEFDVGSYGDYHVTVFPVHGEQGILGSKVAFSQELEVSMHKVSLVLIVASVLCAILVTSCCFIALLVWCWRSKLKQQHPNSTMNNIYELHTLADNASDHPLEDPTYASINKESILSPLTSSEAGNRGDTNCLVQTLEIESVSHYENLIPGERHITPNHEIPIQENSHPENETCYANVTPNHSDNTHLEDLDIKTCDLDHYTTTSLAFSSYQSSDILDNTTVTYADVGGSKNKHGQLYSHVVPKSKSAIQEIAMNNFNVVVYSSIVKSKDKKYSEKSNYSEDEDNN